MKIAAIDIGTNSIQTLIADADLDGSFKVVEHLKDFVLLGEGETREVGLTRRAMADGLEALRSARNRCQELGVEKIVAVATTAVREARNAAGFLELVREEIDLPVVAIPPSEESRLIYLSVRAGLNFGDRRVLIIDVGGGSVEFIVGDRRGLLFSDSVKVGVLRLLERFPLTDPVRPADLAPLENHLERKLKRTLGQIRDSGFDWVVGTSGTTLALASLVRQGGVAVRSLTSLEAPEAIAADDLGQACRWLWQSNRDERRERPGIHPGRVDSLVAGAGLWQYLIRALPAAFVVPCDRALREGIILDYLQGLRPRLLERARIPDSRRRSVLSLAERCHWDEAHSRHVASLALSLFDQLRALHGLDARARELLEFAAYLHDLGYHISAQGHHKHGAYLVAHAELLGFTADEIRMLAAVVRYHRRRLPRRQDRDLVGLNESQRVTVGVLAGLLRVANALDRTHFRVVQGIEVRAGAKVIDLQILARGDAELEVWFTRRRAELLQQMLERQLRVRLAVEPESNAEETNVRTLPATRSSR